MQTFPISSLPVCSVAWRHTLSVHHCCVTTSILFSTPRVQTLFMFIILSCSGPLLTYSYSLTPISISFTQFPFSTSATEGSTPSRHHSPLPSHTLSEWDHNRAWLFLLIAKVTMACVCVCVPDGVLTPSRLRGWVRQMWPLEQNCLSVQEKKKEKDWAINEIVTKTCTLQLKQVKGVHLYKRPADRLKMTGIPRRSAWWRTDVGSRCKTGGDYRQRLTKKLSPTQKELR